MAELDIADAPGRIRKSLKRMEKELALIIELRELAKTENGHLTPFGAGLVALFRDETDARQAYVASLLGISNSAVSQRYNS